MSSLPILSFPDVPFDVFSRIVYYCLYSGADLSRYMQEDDISGVRVDFRQRQISFMRTFATVSSAVRRLAVTLHSRVILLNSPQELATMVSRLDNNPVSIDFDLASLCRRVELRIGGTYDISLLVGLLRRTRNVEVFILRNPYIATSSAHRVRPVAIVDALVSNNLRLTRVQFESPLEELNLSLVKTLLRGLPNLITLHLDKLCIKPFPDDMAPLQCTIPALEVLSVGSLPRQYSSESPFHRTADLLRCFPSKDVLPALTTVYLHESSRETHNFFTTFGPQLEEVGFHLGARWVSALQRGHLVSYCGSLVRVLCTVSEHLSSRDLHPLPFHATLEEVVLAYVDTPQHTSSVDRNLAIAAVRLFSRYGGALRVITIRAPNHIVVSLENELYADVMHGIERDGVSLRVVPRI